MMKKTNISPIRYMGNKNRLIKAGLVNLFPDNIRVFYDLFGGSGTVAYNAKAKKYILNEIDRYIYSIYELFKTEDPKKIIEQVNKNIQKDRLPTFSTDIRRKGVTPDMREYYKKNYYAARCRYNENLTPINILTLMYYSMSTTIRINKHGRYNMPFGNGYFIPAKHGEQIKKFSQWLFTEDVEIYNNDYLDFQVQDYTEGDFVYLDPPYLNTVATYTEGGQWTDEDQAALLKYCDTLNDKNITFGLSNTLKNKGKHNRELLNWITEREYEVYEFTKFDYCTFGTGSSDTKEVYITNLRKEEV